MSGAQDNQTSALENQENVLSRLRGSMKSRTTATDNKENFAPQSTATRTVLGALTNNQRSKALNQRAYKQESFKPQCKSGDLDKIAKPPPFQIHVDQPSEDPVNKECSGAATVKVEELVEDTPLKIDNVVARLRQPLAALDIPTATMDVSFDSPMDMSMVGGEEKIIDVTEVPEYAAEIHTYLREMEVKCRPRVGYMKKQPDITNSMRAILVDWLVEVGEEYKLQSETLYLAVNYIDRFLSSMSVLRGKLQLVGTAAMLLASKFEEIYPPEVSEFVYITDDTYTKKQVLRMEQLVLKVLSFDLAAPTINQFLTQYFLHHAASKQVESLAMYLGELSLVDSDPFLKYLPSQTAAAAYVLANHTITGASWPKSLVEKTGYSLEDLMLCVEDLHHMYLNVPQHPQQSVKEKYKSSKHHEVSTIEAPATLQFD
ncbi:cyclin-A2 [Corythoichthys intestinalis]|uniref:cyclin-A2 n=1 Tax=Corythoichthys intestinalis TaxID=161448 RepID=UPI0025A50994|nr:cyclin-A2 [Corythoichthys intestinalis]XP_057705321.1 cyclin-A2 [Corythoichthys intestinalis]XP_061792984.1 cyclin-A2-like [Nerophis lumbriciformis]